MLELIALYVTSIFLIGALALLGRHNRSSGWHRRRSRLAEEIQETMENRRTPQTPSTAGMGALTPDASVRFSMQLAKLQSQLAMSGSVAPSPETTVRPDIAVPDLARRGKPNS